MCIDKAAGLWYDELLMYNESMLSVIDIIKYSINSELHFPLYQIILHYWTLIFGHADLSLRLLSAIFGFLACICSYFVSENKSKNLLCMFLFGINSFLIYYSQEVKIYSLLVFFAVLNLVFLIRICEKDKGHFLWILSAAGLVFTYTASFLYVIFEVILLSVYKFSKKVLLTSLGLLLVLVPAMLVILGHFEKYTANQNWFYTDCSSFLIVFQNFFSPKLTALDINNVDYFSSLIKNFDISIFICVGVSVLIAGYFIFKSLKNDNINKIIFLSAVMFYLAYFAAFKIYDTGVLSRYLIIILPNFLVLIARGFDFKKSSIVLISCFILINISYLCLGRDAAYKIGRLGFRPAAEVINKYADDGDVVLFRNDTEILDKYLTKKVKKVSVLQDFVFKSEFFINNEDAINKLSPQEKKNYIRNYLADRTVSQNITAVYGLMYVLTERNSKLFIIVMTQFAKYDRDNFIKFVENNKDYNGISYNNLLYIKTLLDIRELCDKNLKFINSFKSGDFVVYEYQKN
ncbi:glycosyltransferase family 39 protein [bacterium]|nr:glycosyltransferase family 39 protein [bacterium]